MILNRYYSDFDIAGAKKVVRVGESAMALVGDG